MKNNLIFVHIPKTGGTTFYTAMNNTYWNTEPNFNYRHIIEKTKTSNAGDIFELSTNDKYVDYQIMMMLRHPIDKVISEYYFFKEMETLMNLVKRKPRDLTDYIKEKQTNNATINFLKGRRLYDNKIVTKKDLEDVIESIEKLNIHAGIFEEYLLSLKYFSEVTGINWGKNIEVKRITFDRPKVDDLDNSLKELIIENNKLDFELYNYCLNRFNQKTITLKKPNINIIKDRYNHVLPYSANACLFGFCMDNKKFIKQNFHFFKDLTFYLLKQKKIKDGLIFTKIWNETFLNSILHHFPDSVFFQKLKYEFNTEGDPLDETYKLAKAVDDFFKENPHNCHSFYTPMQFSASLVVEIKSPKTDKKGFLSKLFKK